MIEAESCGKLIGSTRSCAVSMALAYEFDSDIFSNLRRRFVERMPLLAVGEVEFVGMFRLRIEGRFAPLNAPLNMTDGRGPARPDRFGVAPRSEVKFCSFWFCGAFGGY